MIKKSYLVLSCALAAWALLAGCSDEIAGPNRAPVANAGLDQVVIVNDTVFLDGGGSFDPDGDKLIYHWKLLVAPGIDAPIAGDDQTGKATFVPNAGGLWLVALVVDDGRLKSEPDIVQVRASECGDCSDGLYCNGVEICVAGKCEPGTPPDCSAFENDCNGSTCDEANNRCVAVPVADGTACTDDDLFCTGPERCQAGVCAGMGNPCTPPADCDEQQDTCGDCGNGVVDNGEQCDPGAPRNDHCCDAGNCSWTLAGEMDPQVFCTGAPECRLDVCDGSGSCTIINVTDGTPCTDDQLFCTGIEECRDGVCTSIGDPCPGGDCNHCNEAGDGCFDPVGAACNGGDDNFCNSTCDGAGNCTGSPVDCPEEDGNACTFPTCIGATGSCTEMCNTGCMILDVNDPGTLGGQTPLAIDICNPGADLSAFVCFSDRNNDGMLLENDFEAGLGQFTSSGSVTLDGAAQNPDTHVPGTQGVKICDKGSVLSAAIDTSNHYDIGFKFSMAAATLSGNKKMIEAAYYNGSVWRTLALAGDGLTPSYQDFFLFLPPDADDNPNLEIRFLVTNPSAAGDCAYVDDVQVVDMPDWSPIQVLLSAGFDSSLAPFSAYDPDGDDDDVERGWYNNDWRVLITDHKDANIYLSQAAQLDTTGVDPYDFLVVSWIWRQEGDLDLGRYVFAEYSVDDGAKWRQLSAIGQGDAPGWYVRYMAVLPCEAVGIPNLRLRFIGPASAENQDNRGMVVDNIKVTELAPTYRVDSFGGFSDAGDGIYNADMSSVTPGTATVICRLGCGPDELWSNEDTVSFAGTTSTFGENDTSSLTNDYRDVTEDVSVLGWERDRNFDQGSDEDGHEVQYWAYLWIRFDISSIPPGATIHAVKLHLYSPWRGGNSWDSDQVYKLAAAGESTPGTGWIETSATWNHYDGTNDWSGGNDGGAGDRGAVLSMLTIPQPVDDRWFTWTLNNDGLIYVQGKLSGTVSFTLYGTVDTYNRQFQASERDDGRRPYLEISYSQ